MGHGFSLLALAKGMSTLFAKNGLSRPSLEQICGVFRHVLGLRTARPIENLCSRRTRKATTAFASHEENGFVFSRSHHPPLTRTMKGLYADFCTRTTIANGSKCNTSGGNTRRLLEKEKRFISVRCFSKKLSLSWGRKGLGETPQCDSTRRLTSRPRKA